MAVEKIYLYDHNAYVLIEDGHKIGIEYPNRNLIVLDPSQYTVERIGDDRQIQRSSQV